MHTFTPKRLTFLALIAQGKGASQQEQVLGLAPSTISRYNQVLKAMGLIVRSRSGSRPYVLTRKGRMALKVWDTWI